MTEILLEQSPKKVSLNKCVQVIETITGVAVNCVIVYFYRAMHFSANARSWDCMSSVRLSVTLVDCDHIGWISWKLIDRTINPTPSLFVAKRRSTYSQGNMGKFWGN